MADGDERHGKEPAATEEVDKFPEGMRVLAVDDDAVCLRVLEFLLRQCKYQPTVVTDTRTALNKLREEQFDLVITDVHMPDMDGFKLLELIGLEMDLPVIMMSADGDKATVYKGVAHGACDYLVKPVGIKELKNIWKHVVRKNPGAVNHDSSDSDDADQQPVIVEGEQGGAKGEKCSKKKKNNGDGSEENKKSTGVPTTLKKPRVSWTGELHRRFLEVVNRLGTDKAYPKTILQMMNVDYLTRASVASHLQKYRLYLKRVNNDPRKSDLLGESSERRKWSSCMNMNHQGSLSDHHEHQIGQLSSALIFRPCSNNLLAAPSVLGPHDMPIQSMNWAMGTVGHGGSTLRDVVPWMSDATKHIASGPFVNSFAKISDHTMVDALSSGHSDKEYANFLCGKLFEASNLVPSSHPAGNSFANMPNSGMLEPVNQFPVQPSELMKAPSAVVGCRDDQFLYHVGNSSTPWQNVASSSFPGPMDGAPLIPSLVDIPKMNQLTSFGASPGQMPIFQIEQQNQTAGIISNTTPLAGFNEQMALFNMESNTNPIEMTSDNFSHMTQMVNGVSTRSTLPNLQMGRSMALLTQMVNGASISSALPNLQDRSVAPTHMFNGGDASVQEGPVDQQACDDQPNYSNPFFVDDVFASMLNQDLNDGAFFGGEC